MRDALVYPCPCSLMLGACGDIFRLIPLIRLGILRFPTAASPTVDLILPFELSGMLKSVKTRFLDLPLCFFLVILFSHDMGFTEPPFILQPQPILLKYYKMGGYRNVII